MPRYLVERTFADGLATHMPSRSMDNWYRRLVLARGLGLPGGLLWNPSAPREGGP
jgi:hypothetical protein